MFPGMDAKKMQAAMKQMGISQEEIDASRVVIGAKIFFPIVPFVENIPGGLPIGGGN